MKVVVDACVGASSGNSQLYPQSKCSREILEIIRQDKRIKILICDKLYDEWKRNASKVFGKPWLLYMISSRRVIKLTVDTSLIDDRIEHAVAMNDNQKADAKKDTHILILAQADRIIISLENNSRRIFVTNINQIHEMTGIIWRSPVAEWDDCKELCSPPCNLYKFPTI